MLTTTFRLLRSHHACQPRYCHLAKALGGIETYGRDTPITLIQILDLCGLDDALWALLWTLPEQAATCDRLARLFACDCAEHVLPIWEVQYPDDARPLRTIETARRYAHGDATDDELADARAEAAAAGGTAWKDAATRPAWAAWAAAWAAASWVAGAARWTVAAARAAAGREIERAWQASRLREMLEAERETT